eukprot:8262850-Pyramimonas_sp.AAC.1
MYTSENIPTPTNHAPNEYHMPHQFSGPPSTANFNVLDSGMDAHTGISHKLGALSTVVGTPLARGT